MANKWKWQLPDNMVQCTVSAHGIAELGHTIDVKNIDPKNKRIVKKTFFYEKIKSVKNVE
jgi:hypothetical protein